MNVEQIKFLYELIGRAEQIERNLTRIGNGRLNAFTKRDVVFEICHEMDNLELFEMFTKYHVDKLDGIRREMKQQGVIISERV